MFSQNRTKMKLIKVNEKNKDKFKECVGKDKPMLVLFYADWCPHCQVLKPTWNKIAEKLGKNKKIQVAQIEYSDMEYVPKKYKNIRGYPTIQMIKGGKIISEYDGMRTEQDIEAYIKKYE